MLLVEMGFVRNRKIRKISLSHLNLLFLLNIKFLKKFSINFITI